MAEDCQNAQNRIFEHQTTLNLRSFPTSLKFVVETFGAKKKSELFRILISSGMDRKQKFWRFFFETEEHLFILVFSWKGYQKVKAKFTTVQRPFVKEGEGIKVDSYRKGLISISNTSLRILQCMNITGLKRPYVRDWTNLGNNN